MTHPIIAREIQTIYTGRVFTLRVETIDLPKGGTMKADIIRHPGSVVLIPITEAGEVILVRQFRPAIGQSAWELPAGTVKAGEDFEKAAMRECQEEIQMIPARLEHIGSFFPTPGYCDEEMVFFKVSSLETPAEKAKQDADEDIEVKTFTLGEAREMMRRGEISDMKTLVGLRLI